jgi:hypothetical protein
MGSDTTDIRELLRRFPAQWGAILALRSGDAEFRSFCQDYSMARAALKRWQRSTGPNAGARAVEYQHIVRELEAELLQLLSAADTRQHTLPPDDEGRSRP